MYKFVSDQLRPLPPIPGPLTRPSPPPPTSCPPPPTPCYSPSPPISCPTLPTPECKVCRLKVRVNETTGDYRVENCTNTDCTTLCYITRDGHQDYDSPCATPTTTAVGLGSTSTSNMIGCISTGVFGAITGLLLFLLVVLITGWILTCVIFGRRMTDSKQR